MLSKENLSPYFISCCLNEMESIFKASHEEMVNFIEWHTKNLLHISNEYYFYENDDNKYKGLDTVDRDVLYDCIARYFTKFQEWPRYSTSKENTDEFFKQLSHNSLMLGWQLHKD